MPFILAIAAEARSADEKVTKPNPLRNADHERKTAKATYEDNSLVSILIFREKDDALTNANPKRPPDVHTSPSCL